MDISAFEIAKTAAENRKNSTELRQYWVPAAIVDVLVWLCHQNLIPFRKLQRPPDFVWSGHKLMARSPWVTTPILADWHPMVGANMVAMSIMDDSAAKAFQMFYISSQSTLDSNMVNAMFDHYICSMGGEIPESDHQRITGTMNLLEDWLKTLRNKK
jgi:hypothetical protein